jgi:hypothetical protein
MTDGLFKCRFQSFYLSQNSHHSRYKHATGKLKNLQEKLTKW